MPEQRHLSPAWGQSVGGAKRRPARVVGRNPVAVRARDGGRHPGLQEAGALRGATVERKPRPVRLVRSGSLPLRAVAPATGGCPLNAEEGNVVGVREPRRTHPSRAAPPAPRLGDASFTRSRDPRTVTSRRSWLSSRTARSPGGVGGGTSGPDSQGYGRLARGSRGTRVGPRSTSGKPGEIPEEPTAELGRPDAARLAVWGFALTRGNSRGRPRGDPRRVSASEPGRRLRPPSTYARTRRAPSRVLVRRGSCRSRQASSGLEYARASASEKRTSASERGPSTGRESAAGIARCPSVGLCVERKGGEIRTAPWNQGAGPVKSQGGVRASLGGSSSPRGGRGSWDRGDTSREANHRILGRAP